MIAISLVIPVYNRKKITIAGLENINAALNYYKVHGTNNLSINIIVIDDGSTDGTGNWIKENRPQVIVLQGDGNLWWSGAVNMGAKYAVEHLKSSHVLLWNDDTTCEEDYFYELENILKKDKTFSKSILVSKIFWLHDKNRLFNFGCYYNYKTGVGTRVGADKIDNYKDVVKVDWSGGMGTLIPNEILIAVNYFDNENFPQYHGDLDFFLRAKSLNFEAYAIPGLKIYNNMDTTGQIKANNLKTFRNLLTSNRSLYNLKDNIKMNKRHSNTILSWIYLSKLYLKLTFKTMLNIISIKS